MAGALVLVALVFFPGIDAGYERFHAPRTAFLLLMVTVSWWLARRRLRAGRGGVVLLAWAGLSAACSVTPHYAVSPALQVLLMVSLFTLITQFDDESRARLRWAMVISGSLVAGLVLVEAWGGLTWLAADGRGPAATVGQRNLVAHLLVLTALMGVHLSMQARPRAGWALACVALMVVALVHTRSRAGWLVAALSIALMVGLSPLSLARRALVGGVLTMAVVVSALAPSQLRWTSRHPLRDTASSLLDPRSPSAAGRMWRWRASLPLAFQHPLLGVGPGHWQLHYASTSPLKDPTWDHERLTGLGRRLTGDLVATAIELGPLFLLLALLMSFHEVRRALPAEALLAAVFAAAVLALGFFDVLLQAPLHAALAAAGLGSCSRPPAPWRYEGIARLVCGVLLVAGVGWSVTHAWGIYGRTRAHADIASLQSAARWASGDLEGHRLLAEVLLLEGRCAEAAPLLRHLGPAFASEPALSELASGCGQ